MYHPNISEEVFNKAMDMGLDYITTGGGCDYICCKKNNDIILAEIDDVGTPTNLAEPACIIIFNEGTEDMWWEHGTRFDVESVLVGLQILQLMDNGGVTYF